MLSILVPLNIFRRPIFYLAIISYVLCTSCTSTRDDNALLVYIGAASKPPMEFVIKAFETKTGQKVDAIYGGSGFVLSQMQLAKKGDVFMPGSSDYMDRAVTLNLVDTASIRPIAYLVNAIAVRKGNPKNIYSLKDLLRDDLRVVIANPEQVCLGNYSVEIIEKTFSESEKDAFKNNIVNYAESCDRTAASIALGTADAIIGWRVFQYWNPKHIELVHMNSSEIQRIAYIPMAVSNFTKQSERAHEFIQFVASKDAQNIFRQFHYLGTAEEAMDYIGAQKPVGGQYELPKYWQSE